MADREKDMAGPVAADIERLRALADAHGAALERWPLAARAEAEGLLVRTGEAGARVLEQAAALEAMLGGYEVEPPSVALETAILEGFNEQARARARQSGGRSPWAGLLAPGLFRPRVLAGAVATVFAVSFSAGYAGAAYVQPAGADSALSWLEEADPASWFEPYFEDFAP